MARQLLERGARVAVCGRDSSALTAVKAELAHHGERFEALGCDVADEGAIRDAATHVAASMGPIDCLIANAGVISVGAAADQTLDDYHVAMDIMYWGVVHAVNAVLPEMRRRHRGAIAVISSIGGSVAVPHLLPYSGAKFAVTGFAEGLAAEVRSDGIRVTTVVPGLMRTGSHINALYKGDNRREFGWFAPLASLPVVSMSAPRAARRVLHAIERGKTRVSVGLPAAVATRVHGVAPATTVRFAAFATRAFPRPAGSPSRRVAGSESETALTRSPLLALGRRAAERLQHSA